MTIDYSPGVIMLTIENTILIVTDIQGKLASLMHEREKLYKNLGIMIEGIKALNIPILWIEQYPKGLGPTVPEVASHLNGLTPYAKTTFSSLKDPNITEQFEKHNRSHAILIGIETHICIYQTTMDLMARGVATHVVADAVSSRTPENKHIALERISNEGGHITSVEMALFELLVLAEGEAFKKIVRLVK
ncbi:hydrolase [Candidatus Latescibacterota bacterium]